jgi:hypothetical protein
MNKLLATVSALTLLASMADAQAINTLPAATTPLSGTETAVGVQSGTTVQITANSLAALAWAGVAQDCTISTGGNITCTQAKGNFTVGGNLTVDATTTFDGNVSAGNISVTTSTSTANLTDTALGNCTGGVNTTSGLFACLTPTWASGVTGGNNTAPGCTTAYKMMGLVGPGNATFTPTRSGTVEITACGTVTDPGGNTTAGTGINLQLSYGTGNIPTNNSALTGTQTATVLVVKSPATITATDVDVPVCSTAVANLTVGTAYWVDYAAEALGAASQYTITNTYISVIER